MNGKIMMGFGIALAVWGLVALVGYERTPEGVALIAGGIALLVIGNRQSRRGH
jgi:hypothetical protein